jgi:hypothetical protein
MAMIRKILISLAALPLAMSAGAQTCKVKVAVGYTDGEKTEIGFTAEQKKLWEHEGAKHYAGFCLDAREPNYLILWTEGLTGGEQEKAALDRFNRGRATGQNTSTGPGTPVNAPEWTSSRAIIRPSQGVREKAQYWVLDRSKTPPIVVKQGTAYQDVPMGRVNQPGQSVKTSDLASTISDPAGALENALKWIKKTNKY